MRVAPNLGDPQVQPQPQPQPSPPASPPTEVATEASLEGVSHNSTNDQPGAAESNRVVAFTAADGVADSTLPLNASPSEHHLERHVEHHEAHEAHEAPLTADGAEQAAVEEQRRSDNENEEDENEEEGEEEFEYVEEEVEVEVPRCAPLPGTLEYYISTSLIAHLASLQSRPHYILPLTSYRFRPLPSMLVFPNLPMLAYWLFGTGMPIRYVTSTAHTCIGCACVQD